MLVGLLLAQFLGGRKEVRRDETSKTVLLVVLTLLFAPVLGSANPNGVGSGTFDAQCGGACHGDADMNRSSTSTVVVEAPSVAYEGLLTSVAVTVSDIETTTSGLLGHLPFVQPSPEQKTHRRCRMVHCFQQRRGD